MIRARSKVDSDGMPLSATCDKITRRYTYSNDGFNLKTSECDPLGNYTYYDYHKGTNLLKIKIYLRGQRDQKTRVLLLRQKWPGRRMHS